MIAMVMLCWAVSAFGQTVKRSRNEGTTSIAASNVLGNGNISAFLSSYARYSLDGLVFEPAIGGIVGISDIMQLAGQFIPFIKNGLGPVEAHLTLTPPGNNKLRFFGVALSGDLYLSSKQDTVTQTSGSDKPEYNPYIFPSIIIDADWLSVYRFLPLKMYLAVSMMDNSDLCAAYDQIAVKGGLEWKAYQHSAFVSTGIGFYREKRTRISPGDETYAQKYLWVEPGGRYRLWGRLSLVGAIKLTLYQSLKSVNPVCPELFNASCRVEAPILFKETNTEAIRTLIFMERRKEKHGDAIEQKIASGKSLFDEVSVTGVATADSGESFDLVKEKADMIKRREETQKKIDEIEQVFRQLDMAERSKRAPPADSSSVDIGKK
jgi:hypothetical protein